MVSFAWVGEPRKIPLAGKDCEETCCELDPQCKHVHGSNDKSTSKKFSLTPLLVFFAPYLLYVLIIALLKNLESCLSDKIEILQPFFVLFITITELLNVTLLLPPRRLGTRSDEIMKFDDREVPKTTKFTLMKAVQILHAAIAVASIFALFINISNQLVPPLPPPYKNYEALVWTTILMFSFPIGKAALEGRWMSRYNISTIILNTVALLVGSMLCFPDVYPVPQPSEKLSVITGALILTGAVLHLRFAYFFKFPPRHLCLLTIPEYRTLLKPSFGWVLLFLGCLFSLVTTKLVLETSPVETRCVRQLVKFLMISVSVSVFMWGIKLAMGVRKYWLPQKSGFRALNL
ncbi:hypothetical protein L3Y34_003307 [Caenorhabditis briggsae]|uniref:Uncharacterized protein n=2 Tax=Caenorhabditis briggsae TaxID=6238 RepID=A0AAE9ACZ1_CAEBR|nr:hypothetical protein L3Y34_003307 [Caenorhabditis briggsae]